MLTPTARDGHQPSGRTGVDLGPFPRAPAHRSRFALLLTVPNLALALERISLRGLLGRSATFKSERERFDRRGSDRSTTHGSRWLFSIADSCVSRQRRGARFISTARTTRKGREKLPKGDACKPNLPVGPAVPVIRWPRQGPRRVGFPSRARPGWLSPETNSSFVVARLFVLPEI